MVEGATRIAVFDWTGLSGLNSNNCSKCSRIQFGGELFSGVEFYNNEGQRVGVLGVQKAGPIPLGDECGAAAEPAHHHPAGRLPRGRNRHQR